MLAQRYLLRIITLHGTIALVVLAAIYVAFDLGDQGRRLAAELGWLPVLQATALHLPLICVQLAPAALLVGGSLAIASLGQRGELEALASSGLSPLALGLPLLLLGALVSLFALAASELVVPACERAADKLYRHRRVSALLGARQKGHWYRSGRFFVRRDVKGTRILALRVDRRFRVRLRISGASPARGRGRVPALANARLFRLADKSAVARFARYELPALAPLQALWRGDRDRPEALGARELARRREAGQAAGQPVRLDGLLLHGRLAFPCLGLVATAVLWAFALGRRRRWALQLGLAVAWVALLWALVAVGWLLARSAVLHAIVGAWAPIVTASVLAAWAVLRAWPGRRATTARLRRGRAV